MTHIKFPGLIADTQTEDQDYRNKSFGKADLIPGGLAQGKTNKDFPAKKIKQGEKVELEHTTSKRIAQEISRDHLTEDPNYYSKLEQMEKGQNGDWQKEGYSFSHDLDDKGWHTIAARDKNNEIAGYFNFTHNPKTNTLKPEWSNVGEQHQRKGLASEAYRLIQKHTGIKLQPSDKQTYASQQLWANKDHSLGKSGKGTPIKECPSCKFKMTTKNSKLIGHQDISSIDEWKGKKMALYNCPKCDTTAAYLTSDDLKKGAARRLYGKFNHNVDEYKDTKNNLVAWQEPDEIEMGADRDLREKAYSKPTSQTPNERLRSFNKLAAATQIRLNPKTKEREFLLHRGMGTDERDGTIGNTHVNHPESSSWTPHYKVAKEFAEEYEDAVNHPHGLTGAHEHVASAWIPESQIKGIPNQLSTSDDMKREHEVIVKPNHNSQRAFYKPKKALSFDTKGVIEERLKTPKPKPQLP